MICVQRRRVARVSSHAVKDSLGHSAVGARRAVPGIFDDRAQAGVIASEDWRGRLRRSSLTGEWTDWMTT